MTWKSKLVFEDVFLRPAHIDQSPNFPHIAANTLA
jgi:hypothetical protein